MFWFSGVWGSSQEKTNLNACVLHWGQLQATVKMKTRLVYFLISCPLSPCKEVTCFSVHRPDCSVWKCTDHLIIFSGLLFWNASRRREKKTDWKGYSQNPNLSPQYASVKSWVVAILTKSCFRSCPYKLRPRKLKLLKCSASSWVPFFCNIACCSCCT